MAETSSKCLQTFSENEESGSKSSKENTVELNSNDVEQVQCFLLIFLNYVC